MPNSPLCKQLEIGTVLPVIPYAFLCLLLGFHSRTLCAQGAAPANTQPPAASSELLELPVLVTDHEHRPVDDVKAEQFRIKIDRAEPIAPVALRLEKRDPLALTILIDASRDSFHDLGQLGDDLAGLAGISFLPADRVNLYAIDCTVARSLSNAVPDAETLRKAVADALAYPKLHDGKSSSACGKTVHLWDDVAIAISALSHMPGRRVLLLISSGEDGGSKYDWKTVQQYATDQGVAIFGLRDQRQADADTYRPSSLSVSNGHTGASIAPTPGVRSAADLELLCANAGGLTLSSTTIFRKDAIADILFLVRSRFIVSIPKEVYSAGSSHSVKASLPLLKPYFVSTTGATKPVAEQ
jgi:hypothetical protein